MMMALGDMSPLAAVVLLILYAIAALLMWRTYRELVREELERGPSRPRRHRFDPSYTVTSVGAAGAIGGGGGCGGSGGGGGGGDGGC